MDGAYFVSGDVKYLVVVISQLTRHDLGDEMKFSSTSALRPQAQDKRWGGGSRKEIKGFVENASTTF